MWSDRSPSPQQPQQQKPNLLHIVYAVDVTALQRSYQAARSVSL